MPIKDTRALKIALRDWRMALYIRHGYRGIHSAERDELLAFHENILNGSAPLLG